MIRTATRARSVPSIRRRPEEAVSRHQHADTLMRALEVVVVDEQPDATLRVPRSRNTAASTYCGSAQSAALGP
jgi:hypothetical protein